MKRICYSSFHVGDRFFGDKEPLENPQPTHGICERCWPLEKDRLEKELGEYEKATMRSSALHG